MFLRKKLLEWLECLSLLDELPRAIEAFKVLRDIAEVSIRLSTSMIIVSLNLHRDDHSY
jgi:hypothetical protein